jgi:hypothetical protein
MTMTGGTIPLKVKSSTTINKIVSTIEAKLSNEHGTPIGEHYARFDGVRLDQRLTLADYGIQAGETLDLFIEQRGGKPVIYVYPLAPTPNVRVQLSLVKAWSFSALYPSIPIDTPAASNLGQSVTWTVDATPDGTLFDHGVEREVAYLFWEAQ